MMKENDFKIELVALGRVMKFSFQCKCLLLRKQLKSFGIQSKECFRIKNILHFKKSFYLHFIWNQKIDLLTWSTHSWLSMTNMLLAEKNSNIKAFTFNFTFRVYYAENIIRNTIKRIMCSCQLVSISS